MLVLFVALGACSDKEKPAAPTVAPASAYATDIDNLCEVVKRAGAENQEPNDRRYLIATWLGANLKSPEARKFLADIQPLVGNAKADALDAEAKRVGLAGCALSAEWRK